MEEYGDDVVEVDEVMKLGQDEINKVSRNNSALHHRSMGKGERDADSESRQTSQPAPFYVELCGSRQLGKLSRRSAPFPNRSCAKIWGAVVCGTCYRYGSE